MATSYFRGRAVQKLRLIHFYGWAEKPGYANKLIANYSSVSPPFELDKQWLLTYQLFLDEKIGNPYPTDDAGYKTFEVLKKNKVSFIRGIKKADTKETADPVHVNSKIELVGETV